MVNLSPGHSRPGQFRELGCIILPINCQDKQSANVSLLVAINRSTTSSSTMPERPRDFNGMRHFQAKFWVEGLRFVLMAVRQRNGYVKQ